MRSKRAPGIAPDDFPAWSDKIEMRLKQAIWMTAVLLILFQALLQIPAVRHWLSAADRLEGTAFTHRSGQ